MCNHFKWKSKISRKRQKKKKMSQKRYRLHRAINLIESFRCIRIDDFCQNKSASIQFISITNCHSADKFDLGETNVIRIFVLQTTTTTETEQQKSSDYFHDDLFGNNPKRIAQKQRALQMPYFSSQRKTIDASDSHTKPDERVCSKHCWRWQTVNVNCVFRSPYFWIGNFHYWNNNSNSNDKAHS